MAGRSTLRRVLAIVATVLVLLGLLAALAAYRALERVPEAPIVVRVRVRGGARGALCAPPATARYLAANEIFGVNHHVGRGEMPFYDTQPRTHYPHDGDVTYSVPLRFASARKESLWRLQISGLPPILFGDQTGEVHPDAEGRATFAAHLLAMPELIDVDTHGLRVLVVAVDVTPVAIVTLTMPHVPDADADEEEPPPDPLPPVRLHTDDGGPTLSMRPSARASIGVTVTGAPATTECLRGLVVSDDHWRELFGEHPYDEPPRVVLTIAEWRALAAQNERIYSFTADPGAHTATLTAPAPDPIYGSVPSWNAHSVHAVLGCILSGAASTSVGIVRVEIMD